jgi:hypothetical protein
MKKDITFEDLETLLNSLTKKTNFIYNGVNHGAMVANDGKIVVKNFKTGVAVGKKQFLSQNPLDLSMGSSSRYILL